MGSLALDALMIRRFLTLHYYSTKKDSCEERRAFSKVCCSSMAACEPCVLTSVLSARPKLGHVELRYQHGRKEIKHSLSKTARYLLGMPKLKPRP